MDISRFALAVLLLELTPGPNMAYLTSLAIVHGRTAGLAAVLGVALGLSTHAVLAALGAGVIIEQSDVVYEILRWIGVAYLFYLAWDGWRSRNENSPERVDLGDTVGPLLRRGFLTNVFNPKSILFFVSVVPTFIDNRVGSNSITAQLAMLGFIYVMIATGVHTTIVLLGSRLRPWIIEGPSQKVLRRLMSLSLALVAIWLAWSTRR